MIKKETQPTTMTNEQMINMFYVKPTCGVSHSLGRKFHKTWYSNMYGKVPRFLANGEHFWIEWQGTINITAYTSLTKGQFMPLFELKNPTFNTWNLTSQEIDALPDDYEHRYLKSQAENANGNYNPLDENGFTGGQIGFYFIRSKAPSTNNGLYCTVIEDLQTGTRQTQKICETIYEGMSENSPKTSDYTEYFTTLLFQIIYDENAQTLTIECSSTGGDTWETPVVFNNITKMPVSNKGDELSANDGVLFRPYPDSCEGMDLTINTGSPSNEVAINRVNTEVIRGDSNYSSYWEWQENPNDWDHIKQMVKEDAKRYYYEHYNLVSQNGFKPDKPVNIYYHSPIILYDIFDAGTRLSSMNITKVDLGESLTEIKTLELCLRFPESILGIVDSDEINCYGRPFWSRKYRSDGEDIESETEDLQFHYNIANFRTNNSDKFLQTYIGLTTEYNEDLPTILNEYQQQHYGEPPYKSIFYKCASPSIILCLNGKDYYAPLKVVSYTFNGSTSNYTYGSLTSNDYTSSKVTYTTMDPSMPGNSFTYQGSTGSIPSSRPLIMGGGLKEDYWPQEYDKEHHIENYSKNYSNIILTWALTIDDSRNIRFYANGTLIGQQQITDESLTLGRFLDVAGVYPSFSAGLTDEDYRLGNLASSDWGESSKYYNPANNSKSPVIQIRAYTDTLNEKVLKQHNILDFERMKYMGQYSTTDFDMSNGTRGNWDEYLLESTEFGNSDYADYPYWSNY